MSSLHHSVFYVCLCGFPYSHLNLCTQKLRQSYSTNHLFGSKDTIFFKLHPPPVLCSLPASPLPLFECSPFMSLTPTFILQPSSSLLSHLFRILSLITCKLPETNSYQLHFPVLSSPVPENRLFKRHYLKKLRIITALEVSTVFLRRFRVLLLLNSETQHAVHLCYLCVVLAGCAIQHNHVYLKLKSKSFISLAENQRS